MGAVLNLESVPLASPSADLEEVMNQVTGGDDYQILMVTDQDEKITGFSKIGMITDGRQLELNWRGSRINLPERLGFEH